MGIGLPILVLETAVTQEMWAVVKITGGINIALARPCIRHLSHATTSLASTQLMAIALCVVVQWIHSSVGALNHFKPSVRLAEFFHFLVFMINC